MRLTLKLTGILSLVIACGLVAQSYVHIQRVRALHFEETRDDLELLARVLGPATSEIWANQGEARARAYLAKADERRARTRIRIAPTHGGPIDLGEYSPRASVRGDDLVSYAPVMVAFKPVATLELVRTRRAEGEYISDVIWTQIFVVAAVVGACGALALVVGFWLVGRPVSRLTEHARRVAQGDFTSSEVPRELDELGQLAEEMNAMSDRLAEADELVRLERRRRTQVFEQLRHADRLGTVGKIASGIAHELGTPLNVVSGRATLISSDANATERIRKGAKTILDQSEHMESIVRQLLDFARRKDPQGSRSSSRDLLDHAVSLVEPLAEEQGVSINVAATEESDSKLDSGQTLQVLTNLIVNAIQAMPDGGSVSLAAEERLVDEPPDRHAAPGTFICISVRDEGLGIAQDDLELIFEPFFTTKAAGKGTGLGLSVSHGIVRQHGGWMEAESELGKGSCFRVYLPAKEAA